MVNKHYDPTTTEDLEVLLDELVALLVDNRQERGRGRDIRFSEA
jgi:hypothetical protein